MTVVLEAMTIKGKISNISPKIEVIDSAVGPISGSSLTFIFGIAAKQFIIPKLNEVGQKGFPIPMLKHVKFNNPSLSFDAHALCLTTDVQYVP